MAGRLRAMDVQSPHPAHGPGAATHAAGGAVTRARRGAADDRGAAIALLRISDIKRAAEGPDKRRAALAKRLRDAIKVESRRITWLRLAAGVGGVLVVISVMGVLASTWRWAANFNSVIFWVGVIALSLGMRLMVRRQVARQVAATAVAEGICGGCAYTLEGVPVEPDGCLVCPECGAAWRRERITRPHWESAASTELYEPAWWRRILFSMPRSRDLLAADDRGRFVRVLDSWLQLLPPARRAEWGPERLRDVRARTRRVGRIWRWVLAGPVGLVGAMLAAGAMTVLVNARRLTSDDIALAGVLTGLAIMLGLLVMAIIRSNGHSPPRKVAPVLTRLGLCASCGNSIAGVAPDSDGLATCGECGASWRQVNDGRCVRCGYDLRGLLEPICPECGGRFGAAAVSNEPAAG